MSFLKKHREIILYLVFGALTTLVNFIVFISVGALIGESLYLLSNLIAWVAAVIFAFVVNKLIVFRSPSGAKLTLMREIFEFVAARIFSFGLEELGMFLLVDISPIGGLSISLPFGIALTGQIISKAILAIIVIILNYFFSKFIIFQKHRGGLK